MKPTKLKPTKSPIEDAQYLLELELVFKFEKLLERGLTISEAKYYLRIYRDKNRLSPETLKAIKEISEKYRIRSHIIPDEMRVC